MLQLLKMAVDSWFVFLNMAMFHSYAGWPEGYNAGGGFMMIGQPTIIPPPLYDRKHHGGIYTTISHHVSWLLYPHDIPNRSQQYFIGGIITN